MQKVQLREDRPVLTRTRASRRLGLVETERKCRILEIQPLKLNKEHSSDAWGQTINLPPIGKCGTVMGKPGPALHRKEPTKPPVPPKTRENTLLHVVVTRRGELKQEPHKHKKLRVAARQLDPKPVKPPPAKPRPPGDACSDDSAETGYEEAEVKKPAVVRQEDSDEDYYTDQRITEWVRRVNSSLFSTGSELAGHGPAEDVSSIKIIYCRD